MTTTRGWIVYWSAVLLAVDRPGITSRPPRVAVDADRRRGHPCGRRSWGAVPTQGRTLSETIRAFWARPDLPRSGHPGVCRLSLGSRALATGMVQGTFAMQQCALPCRFTMRAALALLAFAAVPVAAQEGGGLPVALALGQDGTMKANVVVPPLRVDPGGLTIRVRTRQGTLECVNDFTIFPVDLDNLDDAGVEDLWEIDCLGADPSPPLDAVLGVTAEMVTSLIDHPEITLLMRLRSPSSVGLRCVEANPDGIPHGIRPYRLYRCPVWTP